MSKEAKEAIGNYMDILDVSPLPTLFQIPLQTPVLIFDSLVRELLDADR